MNHSWTGLSSDEARKRLSEFGPNALPESRRHIWPVVWEAVREPMFLLLIAAAGVYLVLGSIEDSLVLLFMVLLVIGITLYQEGKTERALEALRDLSSPRALVIRDGNPVRIPARELVPGDLLLLGEGDRIAADGLLRSAVQLQADESALTGEAWPVGKTARPGGSAGTPAQPGGDDSPWVWSGTLVVQGSGMAEVIATGERSEMGKIGLALQGLGPQRSQLQKQSARLVRTLAIGAVLTSLALAVLYGWRQQDWLQGALAGIALAMSLLPEEYPVILAVFPAIGAWRLARSQVLTRSLQAIETLGSISVLCTDKTGTLTENRMVVAAMHSQGQELALAPDTVHLPEPFSLLARYAALASKPQAYDPMETAFHQLAARLQPASPAPAPVLREYGLTPELRAMSVVRRHADGGHDIATKGAPETIARLCKLDEKQYGQMLAAIDDFGHQGLRVLAVARARHAGPVLPAQQQDFAFEYLGLIALSDPLRREIPDAIRQCVAAGIRVVLITGDYGMTAQAIARQAGMPAQDVLNGDELAAMSDDELDARLQTVSVCSRIRPDQKLRIVQALKRKGEVVAMTGDGVNDAPALKAAHVGIAMGGRGTDVAREAAALVLLDDNFASIVRGIRLGRRIFANVRNAMSYVLAMHLPIAGMAMLPALTGLPVLLLPMHIAFLELIIDPACSLAFENEPSESEAMSRPPRDVKAPLFARRQLILSLCQGLGALVVVALAYAWAVQAMEESAARAFGFASLVFANVMLIFASLSARPAWTAFASSNRIPLVIAAAALATLVLTIYLPALAGIFRFSALPWDSLLLALAVGGISLAWFETVKHFTQRQATPGLSASHPQ